MMQSKFNKALYELSKKYPLEIQREVVCEQIYYKVWALGRDNSRITSCASPFIEYSAWLDSSTCTWNESVDIMDGINTDFYSDDNQLNAYGCVDEVISRLEKYYISYCNEAIKRNKREIDVLQKIIKV